MPARAQTQTAAAENRPFHPGQTAPDVLLAVTLCFFLAFLVSGCSGAAPNAITFTDGQRWSASFSLPQTASNPAVDLPALVSTLQAEGVQAVSGALPPSAGSSLGLFQLSGSGGPLQLRRLLYGQLSGLVDPLGEPSSVTLEGMVHAGQQITFQFEANPSTGSMWEPLDYPADLLEPAAGMHFTPHSAAIGGEERQESRFTALKDGRVAMRWVYRQPWVQEDPAAGRNLLIQAPELSEISDWSNPLAPQEVFSLPSSQDVPAPRAPVASSAPLPAVLDWRNRTTLTGIRNQGSCGGCWAFATVGVLESAISIHEGTITDLSEQYLISCNTYGWSCNGGFTAHPWHMDLSGLDQTSAGAVLESSFPYADYNYSPGRGTTACGGSYDHPYKIQSWGYVGNTLIPSESQIKQALLQYGPLATTVCVGPSFSAYRGGVFSTDEKNSCLPGLVNHAVDMVGWDDTQGAHGVWIVRNSWGTGWGDQGYMLIDRSVSNIGYATSSVDYQPSGGPALPANACPATEVLTCGSQVQGRNDQAGSTNLVSSYACSNRNESGPEVTYRFDPPGNGTMTDTLDFSEIGADGLRHTPHPTPDLDLFALNASGSGCQSKDCQAFGDNQLTVPVRSGQPVYLAVDGHNGAVGDYTLSVRCSLSSVSSNKDRPVFLPFIDR